MKNKLLAAIFIAGIAGALAQPAGCRCAWADCPSLSGSREGNAMACHHGSGTPEKECSPRDDCCGKCRLEKNAVFPKRIADPVSKSLKDVPAPSGFSAEIFRTPDQRLYSRPSGPYTPQSFFIRNIVNRTCSFRAPPHG